jgi:Subtilase family
MLTLWRAMSGAAAGAVFVALPLGAPAATAAARTPVRLASLDPAATAQLSEDLSGAWKITKGSGVTVAVLSTGVDPNAPGLQGKVTIGPDYVSLPYPPPVTGTIIAAAIAASGAPSSTTLEAGGRAPQAKILSIRVLPDLTIPGAQAYVATEDWQDVDASAITEAVNSGAQVIYSALVGYASSAALDQAVGYAVSKGVVVVGDEDPYSSDPNYLAYPAALPGAIGAGTVVLPGISQPSAELASPVNESILVSAPGNPIVGSVPNNSSYAAQNPWAAGAWLTGTAALIKSAYPDLAPALVARAIALSARDHPAGGYDTNTGFGLINPAGAVREAAVLAKLRNTAAPGPGVASPSARLVSGPAINAVHHSAIKLAGFSGAAVLGLACLILAMVLARRWRRPERQPG